MDSDIEYDESDTDSVVDMSIGQTSAASVYSFSSSQVGLDMLHEAQGRMFNQSDIYHLPADDSEHSRLDKQHFVHLLSNDGLIVQGAVASVRAALDPNNPTPDGSPKRIADLGCGSGIWTISMALEYPHAEVVGVDLAPNTARHPPPNCRFEMDDFNLGLAHYHGMFDVVHARSCGHGVANFEDFINDMGLCLRPGGVILIVEGDLEMCSYLRQPQALANGDGDPGKSWMARATFEASKSIIARGGKIDDNVKQYPWLCANPLFRDQASVKIFSPIGPWERGQTADETRKLETIGELMRQNSIEFVAALRPLLISEEYPPDMVDRFIAGTEKELSELTVHMYIQWHYCWGIRRAEIEPAATPSQLPVLATTEPVSNPPVGAAPVSPSTTTMLSPPAQSMTGMIHEQGASATSPSTMTDLSHNEEMIDVEHWEDESIESSETNMFT
ncbi:S-adenosyl-L-methionine-dependent methyltransferase [Ceratobasidium sp. AG-I]|nr:S-adenosyl-L-methionine-dependent methyltransferase [Ceratobasidium sp. AG-I]